MRYRRPLTVLLLVTAAALAWLRPWESPDAAPEPPVPTGRAEPAPAVLEGRQAAAPAPRTLEYREASAAAPKRDGPNAGAPTIPEVPPLAGKLTGRVVDADGRAVAGATVQVFRLPTPEEHHPKRQAGERGAAVVWWVPLPERPSTGDDGRFQLAVPEHTKLFVQIMPPAGMAWAEVLEAAGNALEVVLQRSYEVKGRVVDAVSGTPVESARVSVVPVRRGDGWPREGRTGPDGTFVVGSLPEGDVDVDAHVATRRSDSLGLDKEPVPDGVEVRTSARIAAGSAGVELRVWRGYDLAGQVETDRGQAPGATVRIEVYARTAQGTPDQRRRAYAETNADGTFRVDALPRGAYDLLFVPPAGSEEQAATWLRNVVAPARDLRVVLDRGSVLRGRLEDEQGRPVTATKGYVLVREEGTLLGGVGGIYAKLDGSGGFATPAVAANRAYSLLAGGFPGFTRMTLDGVTPGRDDLVIRLRAGREIRGLVRDPTGVVVGPAVRVVAWVPGADLRAPGTSSSGFTDVFGQFVLEGLTEPRYTLAAGGGASLFAPAEAVNGVEPGEALVELRTVAGVSLGGRLVDSRGNPVQTSTLQASLVGGGLADISWTRVDDREGRFLIPGLRVGRAHLSLFRDQKHVQLGEFEVPGTNVRIVVPDP